ncbi:hypothetical protein POTOM_004477 [Populus tomentosa]|uniref:Uncharacterized protein n=1 Tax=Populus tomentosa TaxID=118781 RepID=A0A8X8AKA1_POPTO|nr:hypothetical protein POTOM_004477 [Populus tomentosa]
MLWSRLGLKVEMKYQALLLITRTFSFPEIRNGLFSSDFQSVALIYGQWLSCGKRRLCKVANPSSHPSVVANFVGAILASKDGWKEAAKFLWAVGFAHYLEVFVTLFRRLPTSEALPKELHPVSSMFTAAPSTASIAWETIYGDFDGLSRTYVFSGMVVLHLPHDNSISDNNQVRRECPWRKAGDLHLMSSTMVLVLLVFTLLHAFVWHTLFPNDLAIAITKRRLVKEKKPFEEACDIRRWTKQALIKHNWANKDFGGENERGC